MVIALKKTSYKLKVDFTKDSGIGTIDIGFDTKEERDKRFNQIVEEYRNGKDVLHIECSEEEVDANNFVLGIAFIAAIISAEFHRRMMIKTLMNTFEISKKLSLVAIDCHNSFQMFPPDESMTTKEFEEKIIEWAKGELLDKHYIKM